MDSRMSKYNDDNAPTSRVSRNAELYKQINDSELESFNVRSNSTVIGDQNHEINIEKLKKILDTRYSANAPKRKSIKLEKVEEEQVIDDAPTKEYDLNVVLEQARDDKDESYEEARAKKLRDTQFDILKSLNIEENDDGKTREEAELEELINTIALNETKNIAQNEIQEEIEEDGGSYEDPLDLFSDLKGSDNTEVIEGLQEKIEEIENTEKVNLKNTKKIDNSFYTTTNLFKKKDFSDDDETEDDKLSLWIKILITLIIIVFLVGLFIFLKSIIGF